MPTLDDGRAEAAVASAIGDSTLEASASRVYLAVLRVPRPSRALLIAQGIPASVLDPALAVLAQRGLVRPGPTGELDVPPPLTAMPQLASDLERRAAVVRSTAHDLTQVFYNVRARQQREPDSGIVLLHDLDEVASQTNVLVAGGLQEICVARATSARTRQLLDAPLDSQREPTVGLDSQPLRHRTVWDSDVLEETGADEVLRARRVGGEEQRFFLRVPFSFVLVDDTACLLEWTGDDTPEGPIADGPAADPGAPVGVVLHTPGLLEGVRRLFDRLWDLSSPVDRGSVTDEVDRRDLTILRLLAAGVADASIARQTGVSQRTVERRIRSLLDRLGAGTRFQAGALAVRRGWL